jgi:hypothetical protein
MEIWRAVVGFEGKYEVSNLGRVRSLPGGYRHAKVLKPQLNGRVGKQYQFVFLTNQTQCYVHHMVAAAFIGARPEGMFVCHNNGERMDNRAENLRYDTSSANGLDAVKHGGQYWANRSACANGHEFTDENTRWYTWTDKKNGYTTNKRCCRACDRARRKVA